MSETAARVTAYIDGFNLYHAIDALRRSHLKWVNLVGLAEGLTYQNENLIAVHYFTAYATWDSLKQARHREYVKAVEFYGAQTHVAKFKRRDRRCFRCNNQWISHEEKEADVHIATKLVADALLDRFDRALLISADSDLVPAIRTVATECTGKSISVIAPPGRYGHARALGPAMEITPGRLAKNLMPEQVVDDMGRIRADRPSAYRPPPRP